MFNPVEPGQSHGPHEPTVARAQLYWTDPRDSRHRHSAFTREGLSQ